MWCGVQVRLERRGVNGYGLEIWVTFDAKGEHVCGAGYAGGQDLDAEFAARVREWMTEG